MRTITEKIRGGAGWRIAPEENVVLIGMPGCGKTSIGRALERLTGRRLLDTDEDLEQTTGRTPSQILLEEGEPAFRRRETALLAREGAETGCVIATGGGCVTRQENYGHLRRNGRILWIQRELRLLSPVDRPLSQRCTMEELYAARKDLYARFSDAVVVNDGTVEEAARRIMEAFL